MAERLKAQHWKCCTVKYLSQVRILSSPHKGSLPDRTRDKRKGHELCHPEWRYGREAYGTCFENRRSEISTGGSNPSISAPLSGCVVPELGSVVEWLMALVLKTRVGKTTVGSNPTVSAYWKHSYGASNCCSQSFERRPACDKANVTMDR